MHFFNCSAHRIYTSKFRTDSVNTHILNKERYVKDIVATVKDINDRDSYKQFLLYEIKNTKFKLDNIRISVRTKAEEGIKIGDQVKLSAKLFLPKIAPSEYAYDFARISYYQKISATGFTTSKIVLYKKAEARKFQEYIESFRQYIYENLQQNTKKPHVDIISTLLIGKKRRDRSKNYKCNTRFRYSTFIRYIWFTFIVCLLVYFL